MPLRLKCLRCGSVLKLHDAFAGVTCRCRQCGEFIEVPNVVGQSSRRPAKRPGQPRAHRPAGAVALAGAPATGTRPTGAAAKSAATQTASHSSWRPRFRAGTLGVAGVVVLGIGVGAVVRQQRAVSTAPPAAVVEAATRTAWIEPADPVYEIEQLPPHEVALRTYFTQPISADRIAWVFDAGGRMPEFYGQVSAVTRAALMAMQRGRQSYGVVLATAGEPRVRPLDAASVGSYFATRDFLDAYAPGGPSDLTSAFSAAARQRPDVVFLVVARDLEPREVREMLRQAVAVGVRVNVVSIGEPDDLLARLAVRTAGRCATLSGEMLGAWRNLTASGPRIEKLEHDFAE